MASRSRRASISGKKNASGIVLIGGPADQHQPIAPSRAPEWLQNALNKVFGLREKGVTIEVTNLFVEVYLKCINILCSFPSLKYIVD